MSPRIYDPTARISIATRRLYAAEQVATAEQRQVILNTNRLGLDGDFSSHATLTRIAERYKEAQKIAWRGSILVDGLETLANAGVGQIKTKSQVWPALLSYASSSATAALRDKLVTSVRYNSERNLAHQLNFLRLRDSAEFERVYNVTSEDFLRRLWGRADYQLYFANPLGGIDLKADNIVQDHQIKTLALKVSQNQVDAFAVGAYLQSELDQTRTDVARLRSAQQDFEGSITADLQQVKDGVEGLSKEFKAQNAKVDFRFAAMFFEMPASMQLEALKAGLGPEGAEDIEPKIRLAAKWEGINGIVGKACDAAGTLMRISRALGAPPEFVNQVNAAANAARTVIAAVGLFSTAGALDGLAMVSQLFGGTAGKDESQAQIAKEIAGLYTAMRQLSQQIEAGFQAVLDKLDDLLDQILFNRKVLLSSQLVALRHCSLFLQRREWFGYLSDEARFPSYSAAVEHFSQAALNYIEGRSALEALFGPEDREDFDPILLTRSHVASNNEDQWRRFEDEVFRAALTLAKYAATHQGSTVEVFLRHFLTPARKAGEITDKLALELQWKPSDAYIPLTLEASLRDILDPYLVYRLASYLVEFDPYYEWVKNPYSGELWSIDKLLERPPSRGFQDFLLRRALQIVEVSIAQQTLLSGDVLLHHADRLWGLTPTNPEEQAYTDSLEKLLVGNPLFAHNFLLVSIVRSLTSASGDVQLLSYGLALGQPGASLLTAILGVRWRFVRANGTEQGPGFSKVHPGWAVKVKDVLINLPTPLEVKTAELRLPQQLSLLCVAKARVLGLLLDEEFPAHLDEVERSLLFRVLASDIVGRAIEPGKLLDWPVGGARVVVA